MANSTDNSVASLLGQGDGSLATPTRCVPWSGNLTIAVIGNCRNDGNLEVVASDLPGDLSGDLGEFGSVGAMSPSFLTRA